MDKRRLTLMGVCKNCVVCSLVDYMCRASHDKVHVLASSNTCPCAYFSVNRKRSKHDMLMLQPVHHRPRCITCASLFEVTSMALSGLWRRIGSGRFHSFHASAKGPAPCVAVIEHVRLSLVMWLPLHPQRKLDGIQSEVKTLPSTR